MEIKTAEHYLVQKVIELEAENEALSDEVIRLTSEIILRFPDNAKDILDGSPVIARIAGCADVRAD